jgi:DNA polymerase III delta prime subunit
MSVLHEIVWREKYRPHTIAECVLPDRLKVPFEKIVQSGSIPDLFFYGPPGTGKTSIAKALCDELGATYYYCNGSKANMDEVRRDIEPFAATMAFNGKRKVAIIDEADGFAANGMRAMKVLMEDYSKNCSFIWITNHVNKIDEALHSRIMRFDFNVLPEERQALMLAIFRRCREILKTEGVEYENEALSMLIQKYFPDNRKIIGEMQKFAQFSGLTTLAVRDAIDPQNYIKLYQALKDKNYRLARQWLVDYVDLSNVDKFITDLYENLKIYMKPETIPAAVLVFAKYQDMATRVSNQEINAAAMLIEIMSECEFL